MEAAVLVREARGYAQLSIRAFAARAGVAASTVHRVEQGQLDPTVGMLTRLLSTGGRRLELSAEPWDGPQLAALSDAWRQGAADVLRPDWTRLRAFIDYLALHPDELVPATSAEPPPSGRELMDNLLAGIAEKLSDDANVPRPWWTNRVPAMSKPWVLPGTPRMQAAAASSTPVQLAARGLTLGENSLWRDRDSVGV